MDEVKKSSKRHGSSKVTMETDHPLLRKTTFFGRMLKSAPVHENYNFGRYHESVKRLELNTRQFVRAKPVTATNILSGAICTSILATGAIMLNFQLRNSPAPPQSHSRQSHEPIARLAAQKDAVTQRNKEIQDMLDDVKNKTTWEKLRDASDAWGKFMEAPDKHDRDSFVTPIIISDKGKGSGNPGEALKTVTASLADATVMALESDSESESEDVNMPYNPFSNNSFSDNSFSNEAAVASQKHAHF